MTDHGAVAAERMVAHRGERCFRLIRRQHAHDFTLIGEIERIKPQNLAKAPHLVAQRCALFMYEDADLRRFGDLVEYRCDAATSRVTQKPRPRSCGEQAVNQSVQGGAITLDRRRQRHVAASSPGGRDARPVRKGGSAPGPPSPTAGRYRML